MIMLRTILALFILLLEGFLLLRLIIGKRTLLSLLEYCAYGFFLGSSLSAYAIFGAALLGLPLSLTGLLSAHAAILLALFALVLWRCGGAIMPQQSSILPPPLFKETKPPRSIIILMILLSCWTILKILVGGYDLLFTPVYYNDTYANWNMRSKALYTSETLMLDRAPGDEMYFGGRVPSYPLTVYLSKVWLAKAAGEWNESIVNSIHLVWFFALLTAFFAALRREGNLLSATIGTYALVSLPLLLVHGVNAYTDVLMAAVLFMSLYSFYRWVRSDSVDRNMWLHLFGVMTAAMIFTKNEALLIFLPPLILVFAWACTNLKNSSFNFRVNDFSRWVGIVSLVAIPWILFKIMHGLTFGNATGVSGFSLVPQEGVAFAIEGDLIFTGSYLLLFPLLILILFLGFLYWKRDSLRFLIVYLLIVFAGEFLIYALTPLSVEAIRHTGFGRGMVHLLPLCVFLGILILQHLFDESEVKDQR